jgi:hypothetical protein
MEREDRCFFEVFLLISPVFELKKLINFGM